MIPKSLKWTFRAGIFNLIVGVFNLTMLSSRVSNGMDYGWLTITNTILPFACAIGLLYFVRRTARNMIWERLKGDAGNTPQQEGL